MAKKKINKIPKDAKTIMREALIGKYVLVENKYYYRILEADIYGWEYSDEDNYRSDSGINVYIVYEDNKGNRKSIDIQDYESIYEEKP